MRLAQSIFVAVALLSLAACSGSESPTNPSAAPRIQLTVQVDGRAAADAIPGVSEVAVSATSASNAGTLTYAIDFGDGSASLPTTSARHIYQRAGTFTIRVTATDRSQHTATESAPITVQSLEGASIALNFHDPY